MKKCLILGILSLALGLLTSCRSSTEEEDVPTADSYQSVKNINVPSGGTSLTASPTITWQLGFPIFDHLEIGLGTSTTPTPNTATWTDIGSVTSYAFSGLSLTECTPYYVMIRGRGIADEILDTRVGTTPFRVDLSNPTAPSALVVTENGTGTKSSTVSWTASTDNCGLENYDYAIGTTAGATDILTWSPVTTTSYQATAGVTLAYGTEYYTSVKAIDISERESAVATTAAWRLRPPSALLVGTQNLASNDFNQGASYMRWSSATINEDYFSHSTITNPETLTVRVAGDYFFHLTMPMQLTSGCATRCSIRAIVVVNGTPRTDALANSSYMINASAFSEASNHLSVYLPGLAANDEIKLYVDRGTATVGTIITEGIQAYVEFINTGRNFFYATASQTLGSTNHNLASSAISWTQVQSSASFTHAALNADEIVLNTAGDHLVYLNYPFEAIGACAARNNVKLQVTLNGVQVPGAQANQGGIECLNGHITGSVHWYGLVNAAASDILRVTAVAEASNAVIQVETGMFGSIVIEKLNSIENYLSLRGTRTVASTNLNGAAASPIQWDTQVATDATTYTHSTVTNNHNITITRAGNYLVLFSDHITTVTARVNVRVRIRKNGVDVSSGLCTSNIVTNLNGNNEGSCSLNFVLANVLAGEVITVTTIQEAAAGTATSLSPATLTLLRVK